MVILGNWGNCEAVSSEVVLVPNPEQVWGCVLKRLTYDSEIRHAAFG